MSIVESRNRESQSREYLNIQWALMNASPASWDWLDFRFPTYQSPNPNWKIYIEMTYIKLAVPKP